MIYQDQPSMSLVSNGAECIMISKKFFMEKKTEATMRSIYQSVRYNIGLTLSHVIDVNIDEKTHKYLQESSWLWYKDKLIRDIQVGAGIAVTR
jgi:hypothetical protein